MQPRKLTTLHATLEKYWPGTYVLLHWHNIYRSENCHYWCNWISLNTQ